MENYFVYKHTNKINGKIYIGITKQSPEKRWGANGVNYKNSPFFWNAINKYGWKNFTHEILYENLTKERACEIEKILIKKYKTQNRKYGYNITEGGSAPTLPKEVRKKMSKAMKGNKNGLGKKCSEEKKKKISKAQKGRRFTEEHKKNISKAKKGKTHKPISLEARKKIAEAHEKKRIICVELNIIFPSIQECARALNLHATNICKCCKGKIKSTGNLHFQYVK